MRENREFKHLGDRLRAERPSPRPGLISAIVPRLQGRVRRHPRASLRFALVGALAVALVAAVTAVGAVGYASKQVSHVVVAVKHTVSNTVSPSPPKPPVRRPVAPAPAGSASSQYKGAPKVTGFEPKAACPGQQITIFGSGFKKATAVFIGGHSAKFRISSDGVIHATVPNGFTGGSVTVVSAKGPGTAPHSLKLKFKGCHRT